VNEKKPLQSKASGACIHIDILHRQTHALPLAIAECDV